MLQRLAMLLSVAGLVVTAACAQSDPGITTAVKSKLAADDTVKAYQIDVDTSSGVVTLTGNVDTSAAKEKAIILARGTAGVADVVDHLNVGAPATSTTGEIKDDLDAAGRATKDAGERAIDSTKGAAERTGEVVGDAAITTAVKAKLLGDTTTPGLSINVDTKDGVVTLSGAVKNTVESERAMSVARDTDGVKRVVNNLKINR
jgi:hyperosmotically inducible protein